MKEGMSRRRILQAGLIVAPFVIGGLSIQRANEAAAQQKATKQQVQYQESPKKGQECSKCLHFIAPDSCKMVGGKINPRGWCLLFAPKGK
jgi:hypothetical protein